MHGLGTLRAPRRLESAGCPSPLPTAPPVGRAMARSGDDPAGLRVVEQAAIHTPKAVPLERLHTDANAMLKLLLMLVLVIILMLIL